VTVVLFLGILGACGSGDSTDVPSSADSGIRGVVLAGPQCPVVTAESPCPDVPWRGRVQITKGGDLVAEVTTSDDGRFAIAIEPGSYGLVPVIEGGPQFSTPQRIEVVAHDFVQVTLTVDTGIR
jgi:hypothetical protein